MTDYNGWTNWETWHTVLLADNDERLYNQIQALASRCAAIKLGKVRGKVHDQTHAVAAIKRALAPAWRETRDFARSNGWDVDNPNWDEITTHLIDEAILNTEVG